MIEVETLNKASNLDNYQASIDRGDIVVKQRDENDAIYAEYVRQNLARTHDSHSSENMVVDIHESVMDLIKT